MHCHHLRFACAPHPKISKHRFLAREGLFFSYRIPFITFRDNSFRDLLPNARSKCNRSFPIEFVFVTLPFLRESGSQVFLCCALRALIPHAPVFSATEFTQRCNTQ